MAITHDLTSSTTNDGSQTYTLSHTVGTGDNRLLIVYTVEETADAFRSVTNLTYGGVALTKVNHSQMTGTNEGRIEMWYLLAPAVGTANVEVTFSAAPGTGSALIASSYFGVLQQAPEVSNTNAAVAPTTHTLSLVTVTDNAWRFGAVMGTSSSTAISTTGHTERANVTNAGAFRAASGDEAQVTAGAGTLAWSFGASDDCCSVGAGFAEAGILLENISVTENRTVSLTSFVSVFDVITATENVTIAQVLAASVFDSVSTTENVSLSLVNRVDVNDTVSVGENVSISPVSFVSVSDSSTVTENVNLTQVLSINHTEITYSAVTSGQATNTNTITVSHTIADRPNRVLIVGVQLEDATDDAGAHLPVTGITYGGVALSKIRHDRVSTNNNASEIWYLLAPAVGTANIVVNTTGTVEGITAGGISLRNIKQQAPEADNGTTTTSATGLSVNVTTISKNSWVIDSIVHGSNAATLVAGANQDERYNLLATGTHFGAGSTEPTTTPGAVTMSWTSGTTSRLCISVAAFAPHAGTAESIFLTEGVTMSVTGTNINVSDSVTVTENVAFSLDSTLSVSDSVALTEGLIIARIFGAFGLDVVNVNEAIDLDVDAFLSVSDTVSVVENLSVAIVWNVSVSDAITVTESATVVVTFLPLIVYDTVNVYEDRAVFKNTLWTDRTGLTKTWDNTHRESPAYWTEN